MKIGRIDSPSTKLTGYIDGLIAANNAVNPNTDVDFGSGVAWCNDRLIENTSTRTKILSGTWVAGNNNGGRFSGVSLSVNTWYHCFIMRNTSTNAIDFGFDTSVTGASKPSGWDARLIWSVKTDSSGNIIQFFQRGSHCIWSTPILDYLGAVPTSALMVALSSPPGLNCDVELLLNYYPTNGSYYYLSDGVQNDDAPNGYAGFITGGFYNSSDYQTKIAVTNTSSQVRIRSVDGGSTDTLFIATKGFVHPRGRRL